MDSSWSDTLCPLVRPPTALAKGRANTTPMSQGLSVFLRVACVKQLRFQRKGEPGHGALWREGRALHHCGA